MSIGLQGENLIFLISQPRAGSTLLQRILANHPEIHTTPEPWIMLPPLYAFHSQGSKAEYNANLAEQAMKSFLHKFSDGKEAYFEGVRRMNTYLYERALADSSSRYFLDKTPRYYFIIPELYQTFPKAQYLILWRNPLAVLCSIIKTWVKEDWAKLYLYQQDLLKAPQLLLQGAKLLETCFLNLRYEQLLTNSEQEVSTICEKLEIDFLPNLLNLDTNDTFKGDFGYRHLKEVHQQGKPDEQNLDKWIIALEDQQIWRVAHDYLHLLGQETIEQMGYSYTELQQLIDEHRPLWIRSWRTLSLSKLLKQNEPYRTWYGSWQAEF